MAAITKSEPVQFVLGSFLGRHVAVRSPADFLASSIFIALAQGNDSCMMINMLVRNSDGKHEVDSWSIYRNTLEEMLLRPTY